MRRFIRRFFERRALQKSFDSADAFLAEYRSRNS